MFIKFKWSAAPPPNYEAQEKPPEPQLELLMEGMAPDESDPLFRPDADDADISFLVRFDSHFGHSTSESEPNMISSNI